MEFPFATRWLFFVSQPGLALLKAASRPLSCALCCGERGTESIPIDIYILIGIWDGDCGKEIPAEASRDHKHDDENSSIIIIVCIGIV